MLAVAFFVSTIGFSAYVVIQANKDESSNTDQTTQDTTNQNNNQEADVLKGTKLQGFEPRTSQVEKLEIIDLVEGDGTEVVAGDQVTVNYTGAFVKDGIIFESSLDSGSPITFGLEGLIQGWQDGIPGMKVGGTRRLVIPYSLAYGETGNSNIPAKSDLVFDIELIGITQ
ncbi:FKBP-type peptidyl-prolyl cis-trans isomerase [Candidatus Saccharibacteria bacterium]|nr:FKBP-type peptidyl-prolyl cis-trans isomerase [Candidatus Saccharibacteria bacterium]MCB9821633.1 FKBP-type peptidyl-prolyl cis-trans isomerase [Candidatus Nomurabacteria bacterium]